MARAERSAGFVIFVQPASPKPAEFLLLDYGRHWDFAKGHVEAGEDDLTAATRELAEETGLVPKRIIDGFQEETTYFFRQKKRGLTRKTVVFFLAEVADRNVRISHEHKGYVFLPYEKAVARVTFPTARQMLRLAWERLQAEADKGTGDA